METGDFILAPNMLLSGNTYNIKAANSDDLALTPLCTSGHAIVEVLLLWSDTMQQHIYQRATDMDIYFHEYWTLHMVDDFDFLR